MILNNNRWLYNNYFYYTTLRQFFRPKLADEFRLSNPPA